MLHAPPFKTGHIDYLMEIKNGKGMFTFKETFDKEQPSNGSTVSINLA